MAEAADFIKQQTLKVAKMLTKEHHKIIEQFFQLKKQISLDVGTVEQIKQDYVEAMIALACKFPVMEAAYAMSQDSALSLFDCLVPILEPKHVKPLFVSEIMRAENDELKKVNG